MEINHDSIVGEIVNTNFKAAKLFEQYKIDFCCGGGISLQEACEKSGTDVEELIPELELLVQMNDPDAKYFNGLALDELSDYIEKRHHTYVSEHIPFLQQKLQKLCDVHGDNHPELSEVRSLFDGAAGNLSQHMKKEELILFPYIRRMVQSDREGTVSKEEFGGVLETIEVMHQEHQAEGERFEKISELTSEYTCPPDGCNTYRVTYQTLAEFELDLHQHIHLENNILFKKALSLEKKLLSLQP